MQRRGPPPATGQPVSAFVLTIEVPDVDASEARVVAAGGQCVVPKQAIPGVGWNCYCTDTEGNIFGLHEPDPAAA